MFTQSLLILSVLTGLTLNLQDPVLGLVSRLTLELAFYHLFKVTNLLVSRLIFSCWIVTTIIKVTNFRIFEELLTT